MTASLVSPSEIGSGTTQKPLSLWQRLVKWFRRRDPEGYVRRAKEVFGDDLPPVDVYLFRSRLPFKDFYKSLFGVDIPTAWQNGTGNSNAPDSPRKAHTRLLAVSLMPREDR